MFQIKVKSSTPLPTARNSRCWIIPKLCNENIIIIIIIILKVSKKRMQQAVCN